MSGKIIFSLTDLQQLDRRLCSGRPLGGVLAKSSKQSSFFLSIVLKQTC